MKNKIIKTGKNNIEIRFCGVIKNTELDEYLYEKTDILFAMGTSVLNGASVGVPSHIIPSSTQIKFDCNKFIFLPDTTDYIAGFYPNQISKLQLKTIDFETVVNNVINNNNKLVLGKMCYDYVNQNFNTEKSCKLFKKALSSTTLDYTTVALIKSIQDVKKITKRVFPLKYKILDRIWRYYKKRYGDFQNISEKHPVLYLLLDKLENHLLDKGIIMEDLIQGFKDIN